MTMTADNIGYKHLAPKLRDQERYRAYRILMSSSTLPSEVMALLEKRLTDFINRRLIKAYGALFNAAYTSRKSKVIAHVSEIADMIAKIQMRDDKFRKMKAERELKSSGWLESDVELDESNVMLVSASNSGFCTAICRLLTVETFCFRPCSAQERLLQALHSPFCHRS